MTPLELALELLRLPDDMLNYQITRLQAASSVGTAVAEQRPLLIDDVDADPRYVAVVPGAI